MIKPEIKKFRLFLKDFLSRLKQEGEETSEAYKILVRYTKGEKISKEDCDKFKTQMIDVLKLLGLGIPYILIPGSTLLLALLVSIARKYKIDILPSSFKDVPKNLPK
jgi:hypothetical protein